MADILAIGERVYSSWSLRGWLLFARYGLPVTIRKAPMYTDTFHEVLADFAPARTVPAVLLDGVPVWDSLAIGETLAERHPDLGFWPADPAARALARAISAEMHSAFTALRGDCPMLLRAVYKDFSPRPELLADLERLTMLWSRARDHASTDGPWLFGAHSIADVMFAPVATRIVTYDLPVSDAAAAYVETQITDPHFIAWRNEGLRTDPVIDLYDPGLPASSWPTSSWPEPKTS